MVLLDQQRRAYGNGKIPHLLLQKAGTSQWVSEESYDTQRESLFLQKLAAIPI